MHVNILKAKIHRARITARNLYYHGSFGIDEELMEQVGILPHERLLIGNMANGQRFETYAIPAPRGSRAFELNGAVARLGETGDEIVILAFTWLSQDEIKNFTPKVIELSDNNQTVTEVTYASL